jgi:hypothetical protein
LAAVYDKARAEAVIRDSSERRLVATPGWESRVTRLVTLSLTKHIIILEYDVKTNQANFMQFVTRKLSYLPQDNGIIL